MIVTGGSRGIGAATATLAAERGYAVAINYLENRVAASAVVDGIEFRSVTVTAHKGKQDPCYEANQAVLYAEPWKRVEDDDGHVLERGARTAVCLGRR